MTGNGNDLQLHHGIINDVWKFIKYFSDIKDTDAYWNEMIDVANKLSEKHDAHPLCDEMLILCMDYFCETARGKELKRGWRKEKYDQTEM